jgi:hypothetical protein
LTISRETSNEIATKFISAKAHIPTLIKITLTNYKIESYPVFRDRKSESGSSVRYTYLLPILIA